MYIYIYIKIHTYLFSHSWLSQRNSCRTSKGPRKFMLHPAVRHLLRHQLPSLDLRDPGCSDLGCHLGLEPEARQGPFGMGRELVGFPGKSPAGNPKVQQMYLENSVLGWVGTTNFCKNRRTYRKSDTSKSMQSGHLGVELLQK